MPEIPPNPGLQRIFAGDLAAYAKALPSPTGERACVAIEQAWDLFGYPPQVVTEVLSAVADGAGFDDALDAALAR